MPSGAVRRTRLEVLKTGAASPKSACRLTEVNASFSHPLRALAIQLSLTPNLEWQLWGLNGKPSCHNFLRHWLQLLRLPKATRRQPDSITAYWQGLSLMNIYWLEALSLPSPSFCRSTAAQSWALIGDPKQPSIDLTHLSLKLLCWALFELWVFASSKQHPAFIQSLPLVTFSFSIPWALGKD